MAVVFTENQYYQDIADAIRSKNGSSDTYLPSEMAAAIEDISGGGSSGGGGSASDPVKFIDYDGTILHSYSVADFMTLTAMPENPSHSGLTSQGWNWSLADAKAQLTAYPEVGLTIGQMYITDDGKTRIYVHFEEASKSPYFGICPKGTVTVDWGDGSATDTLTGTSLTTVKTVQHVFPSAGDYVITLTVETGSFAFLGVNNTSHILKRSTATTANISKVYTNAVQKIELGTGARIGSYAFQYCYSLASITIPSSVTSIGTYAFYNCGSLVSITIPDGVTNIGNDTFNNCYSLASIIIPDGITKIGNNAFYGCNSITSITIPSSVTSIGSNAFYACCALASITIPDGVTSIGTYAFYACYPITSIIIPSSMTSIENGTFQYCYSLASITIQDSITRIGSYAFQYCYSLASITIPDGITSIGTSAFQNCHSLASLTIPDGVTIIGNSVFSNCQSIASITIPDGVTNIGSYAFQNCYGMQEYHFLPTTPPTLTNTNAFTNIQSDCIIYVPQGSLEAYQTATNWSNYASKMQEEPAS